MTPSQVSALRVLGLIISVLGGLVVLAAVAAFIFVGSLDEHCPPNATCDGKGMLSIAAIAFGGAGAVAVTLGGVVLGVAHWKGKLAQGAR